MVCILICNSLLYSEPSLIHTLLNLGNYQLNSTVRFGLLMFLSYQFYSHVWSFRLLSQQLCPLSPVYNQYSAIRVYEGSYT